MGPVWNGVQLMVLMYMLFLHVFRLHVVIVGTALMFVQFWLSRRIGVIGLRMYLIRSSVIVESWSWRLLRVTLGGSSTQTQLIYQTPLLDKEKEN